MLHHLSNAPITLSSYYIFNMAIAVSAVFRF